MRKLLLLAAFALLFAGCGNEAIVKEAETEGVSVDAGDLSYQVQLSRYLNPGDVEDREYLTGLPTGTTATLGGDEIWFGVWMRVKNYSDQTRTPTKTFTITDTQGHSFTPVALASTNVFAYNPHPLGPANVLPQPSTAAASGPIQGSLILFKLTTASIQNRPLTLKIESGSDEPAMVSLDL